ncbi:MAG: thiol reductant ABC exporter subunit CydC [Pelagibacterium sp. SCN 63-23]|nr:MAG: thiol reductant ABC exporter subunit CydC [Pelagibacterium sp. SCN 63-23]
MKALLFFVPLFRQRVPAWLLALFLSLVTLLAGTALLGTSGWFITATALTTAGLGFNLFVPSSMVRGLSFIRILARYGERLVGHDATLRLLSDLRGWLFGALFPRLPLPDRSMRHGDLVSRLTADVDSLDTAFLVAIGPWLSAILIGTGMTVLLALLLPGAAIPYGLAILGAAILVPAGLIALGRKAGRDSVEASADLRMGVLDGVVGHADLVVMGALGSSAARFETLADRAAAQRRRLGRHAALAGLVVQALAGLALVATLWSGLVAVEAGAIDGPMMAALLLAVLASFEAIGVIVRSVGKANAAMAAAERLQAIANLAPAIREPDQPVKVPRDGAVSFDAIHFAYPGLPPILDNLSLTIEPGERIAIAGPSGMGKSTLLRLLLRLVEPQRGAVRLGGIDVRRLRSGDVHAHMALLGQDSPVFIDSIRNNLLIGRADAGEHELWEALGKAQLSEHVASLPQGLDTVVGEAGRTLSAGQARRLCLARALVSNAPVLLLDEPTNALDRDTAEAFFRTLATAVEGRTIIMVTHAAIPPGTVDRVLMLENGRLS